MTKRRLKIMRRAYSRPCLKVSSRTVSKSGNIAGTVLFNQVGITLKDSTRPIMRVITQRATMLAGERSRGAISPGSILSESRKNLNCMHWHIFHFMWLRRIYEFLCVHSNPIWKGRNCRDYRPSIIDACAVQMYKALSVRCQRCTKKKKNNKKITLRCIVIGACAVQFLHYVPLYRNTQHYATLNCSVKTSLRTRGTYKYLKAITRKEI